MQYIADGSRGLLLKIISIASYENKFIRQFFFKQNISALKAFFSCIHHKLYGNQATVLDRDACGHDATQFSV